MTPKTPQPEIPSNYITEAAVQNGQPYVYLKSNGRPENTTIALSTGQTLGLVQRTEWSIGVDGLSRLNVETIASPAEFWALADHTTVLVKPDGNPLVWACQYYINKLRRLFTH